MEEYKNFLLKNNNNITEEELETHLFIISNLNLIEFIKKELTK